MTYGQAVKSAIAEEMRRDPRVVLMGEDIGHHGGMFQVTKGLFEEFGEDRIIDTPISESGFIGMALGAALTGLKPVVEIMFFDFSLVAMDQILNQLAKTTYMSGGLSVPLVIRTQGGGYKGAAAQHSQMLESLFLHVPGLKVVAPSSASDAAGLLKAAIRDPNPVLFIEHNQLYAKESDIDATEIPLGKAAVKRSGSQASIFSYSFSLTLCLEAAEQLAKEGIDVEVVDMRTLNPLDFGTVEKSVKKTHRALIVHESAARCGFGADLAAQIQEKLFDELDGPILRVTGADHPLPFAKDMEFASLPTVDKIIAKVKEVLA
ncbi:MAG TPA: alpha-ketoacid dehydrogenase subunit beta [Fimbriimonadaceae bacterium]|jgi:pyruvate dehydrogenase E1 component beta subunit